MRQVILYRGREFEEDEKEAAEEAGFYCTDTRLDIKSDDFVVSRYSCLPFYREQEKDLIRIGARMLNSYSQHCYIADLGQWYQDLKGLTPDTWKTIIEIPDQEQGPFFVKGQTNSKKFLFDSHCLAKTRKDIGQVVGRLQDDTMIGQQDIYIRKFESLITYGHGLHGMPITQEYRFFTFKGLVLSGGYYWSSHLEDLNLPPEILDSACVPKEFLDSVLSRIKDKANGIVVDVGKTLDGRWIVIELNDLNMAGLSENDPRVMYGNLYKSISRSVDL